MLNVPVVPVTLPVTLPTRSEVIEVAANPPALLRATTLPITALGVASTDQVKSVDPSKFIPTR